MKKILIITVLIFLLLPFAILASLWSEEKESVNLCHKFVNTGKFFAYNFYYASENDKGLKAIEPNQCLQFEQATSCQVYAIKKNNITKLEKEMLISQDFSLNNMLASNYVIKTDTIFVQSIDVPKSKALAEIENHYVIKSINEQLDVAKYKQVNKYQDGREEVELFDINKVEMGFSAFWDYVYKYWYWYVIILGLIVFLIIRYKKIFKAKVKKQKTKKK